MQEGGVGGACEQPAADPPRAVSVALALLVLAGGAGEVSAHPLGAFSLNRYARIELSAGVVRVHYVIDLAEIPSYQVRGEVDTDPDGYLGREVAAAAAGLDLVVAGSPVDLRATGQELTRPRGDGGMRRVRIDAVLEGRFESRGPDRVLEGRFADRNQPGRVGWREIVVAAAGDARIVSSSVPAEDASDALRAYPGGTPLDVRAVTFRFTPGAERAAGGPVEVIAAVTGGSGDPLAALLDRRHVTPAVLVGMLLVAALVGAAHALAPGHGKTLMAAYLVGSNGRPVDVIAVGVVVAGMQTASLLLLGGVLLQLDRSLDLSGLYPLLTTLSGLAVIAVGSWLLRVRLQAYRAGHAHRHHGHGHDPSSQVPPLSRRGLVLLASSGGVVPSPSAVLVVVGAFALGRAVLGLGLVLAFSVGLAATLSAVGLAPVVGSRVLGTRSLGRLARAVPLAAAALLPVLGSCWSCGAPADCHRDPLVALPNVTRVRTFGEEIDHWIRMTVDPRTPGVFSFSPAQVPGP